ncbi:hypothetical protein GWJ01_08570 [Proteus sp. G2618]|uniref:hypothetical protein n=1 Tax=Proteus TaxID=583 RepID=UPI000D69D4CD|nr:MULTISPECIES: hypothetical protein [Proteus]MBG5949289.1 hypothetical protein [Proteus terrae]NBN71161.1 hypothetical protein [Proteus sp. G2618]
MGVILCSLLIATIAHVNELINQTCEDLDEMSLRNEAGSHLLEIYSRCLDSEDSVQEGAFDLKRLFSMERQLSRSALKMERDTLQQLRKLRHTSEHIFHCLRHELDLKEETLNHHLS